MRLYSGLFRYQQKCISLLLSSTRELWKICCKSERMPTGSICLADYRSEEILETRHHVENIHRNTRMRRMQHVFDLLFGDNNPQNTGEYQHSSALETGGATFAGLLLKTCCMWNHVLKLKKIPRQAVVKVFCPIRCL